MKSSLGDERHKVLIVPSDLLQAELDDSFLQRRSFMVKRAADGREALALAEAFGPELVLFGSGLWDVGPSSFCQTLRSFQRPPRLVMITDQLLDSWDDALSACTDGHFASPVDREELLEALATLLDVRQRRSRRVSTELLARAEGLSLPGGPAAQLVNLLSLSGTGGRIEANEELAIGVQGRLTFRLPTGRRLSPVCVVRILLDEIQLHYAVEFNTEQDALEEFVSSQAEGR